VLESFDAVRLAKYTRCLFHTTLPLDDGLAMRLCGALEEVLEHAVTRPEDGICLHPVSQSVINQSNIPITLLTEWHPDSGRPESDQPGDLHQYSQRRPIRATHTAVSMVWDSTQQQAHRVLYNHMYMYKHTQPGGFLFSWEYLYGRLCG
jgi:hypothetical protein